MDRTHRAIRAFDFLTWTRNGDSLGIYHESHFHCIGIAHSKGRRCLNPINAANRAAVIELVDRIVTANLEETDVSAWLKEAATLSLCVRFHRDQAQGIISRWRCLLGLPLSGCTVRPRTTTEVTEMPDSPTPAPRRQLASSSTLQVAKREPGESLTGAASTAAVVKRETPTRVSRAVSSQTRPASRPVLALPPIPPSPSPSPKVDLYSVSSSSDESESDSESESDIEPDNESSAAPSPASSTTSIPDTKLPVPQHTVLALLPPGPSTPSSNRSPAPPPSSPPPTHEAAIQTALAAPSTPTALEVLQPQLTQLIQSITQLTAVLSTATAAATSPPPPPSRPTTPTPIRPQHRLTAPLTPITPNTSSASLSTLPVHQETTTTTTDTPPSTPQKPQSLINTPLQLTPPRKTPQQSSSSQSFIHTPLPLTPPRSQPQAQTQTHEHSTQLVRIVQPPSPTPTPARALTLDAEFVNQVAAAVVVALGMVQGRGAASLGQPAAAAVDVAV